MGRRIKDEETVSPSVQVLQHGEEGMCELCITLNGLS